MPFWEGLPFYFSCVCYVVCDLLQTYQVYAMRSAEDVYKLLTAQKASYVIIEEELCNEMSPVRGCRIKDLLDYANGHVGQITCLHHTLTVDIKSLYTRVKIAGFCKVKEGN